MLSNFENTDVDRSITNFVAKQVFYSVKYIIYKFHPEYMDR